MPYAGISSGDRRLQSDANDATVATTRGTEEQKLLITDIISEGPIAGLVDGGTSVFLDNDSLQNVDHAAYSSPEGVTVSLTSGQTAVTVNTKGNTFNVKMGTDGKKYLMVQEAYEISVTAAQITPINNSGTYFSIPLGGRSTLTRTAGDNFRNDWNHPDTDLSSYRNTTWKITHGSVQATLVLNGHMRIRGVLDNIASGNSNTTGRFTFRGRMGNQLLWNNLDDGSTVHTLYLDEFLEISTISGTTITLANAAPYSATKSFSITSSLRDESTKPNGRNTQEQEEKYEGAGYHFNPGTIDQEALPTIEGVGTSATPLTVPSGALEKDTAKTITKTGGQSALIDEVKLMINYSSGLYTQDEKKGKKLSAAAAYKIQIQINDGGSWGEVLTVQGNTTFNNTSAFAHGGTYKKGVSFEFRINLEQYQPFNGFKIIITRLTNHDYNANNGQLSWPGLRYNNNSDHKMVATSVLSAAIGIIKEKLNFPYTAYANVVFSSKNFPSVPKRTYECQGLKVKVPSNYITREENDGVNALYKRNVTTGATESTNQFWNGAFRPSLVYTDNPAWVFYDLVTNDRYGLGDYMDVSDIDKYSLYNIAKYCDELVPDGKGGQEPRFRANLYITKATDAYKLLKDVATIFRGMLYWANSQFFAVTDQKKQPIYNFSKANVIDGVFSYESTGEKTRVNQVIVTWNNPESDYKLEPLVIEDRENQIKTGKIKSMKSIAFGCTSEGQAIRYGRWKIWTSINQTEVVSFETGVNAAFLGPGDIINIQDESDFGIAFSGRVHSCTNSAITIDRAISSDFASGYTYTISVILPKRTVLLNQDTATIATSSGNVTYSRGAEITEATVGGSVTTLLNANEDTTKKNIESALDTSGAILNLQYETSSIVEERTLTTGSTTTADGRDTIPISSAFSETPANEAIWAIKQIPTGGTTATEASYKQYKILTIGESSKSKIAISAVEYYPVKFDSIDTEFKLDLEDPLYPPLGTVEVPKPKNLAIIRDPLWHKAGEELIVSWDPPDAVGTSGVSTTYRGVQQYEISHSFGPDTGRPQTFTVAPEQRALRFNEVTDGKHEITVQTIAGTAGTKRSAKAVAEIEIKDVFGGTFARHAGVIKGAYSSADVEMIKIGSDKGTLKFTSDSYVVLPLNADPEDAKRNTTADADSWSLDCTPLAHTNWPQQNSQTGSNQGDWSFVLFDYSAVDAANPNANALKLALYKRDDTLGSESEALGYWYDGAKYVNDANSIWTSLGTCSVESGSRKVVGSGFNGVDLFDTVKIGSAFGAKVGFIESNTVLWMDRPWTGNDATGQAISKNELSIDYVNDFLVCGVSYHAGLNDSAGNSGLYGMGNSLGGKSLLIVQEDLEEVGRSLVVTSNVNVINYEPDDTDPTTIDQVTTFSNLTLTMDCIGYKNPQIQVTGNGFSQVSASADTGFVNVTNNVRTLTIHNSSTLAYSATSLDFTIVVREREDESNTNKQITKTFSIVKVKDGSIGTEGKTVDLTSTDWTITYKGNGGLLEYTSASGTETSSASNPITFTAVPRNFTEPLVRIKRKAADGTVNWLTGSSSTNYFLAEDNYTATYTPPTSGVSAHSEIIEVDVAEKKTSGWPATSDVKATDSNTLIYLVAGQGGFHISLSNPAHAVPAANDGTVSSYSGSGTTISFYANGVQVPYDASSPYANNSWYVTGVASTNSSNWSYGGFSNATSNSVTLNDHSYSTMADSEVILITLAYKDTNGVNNTVQARQTLFKNKAGPSVTGADGKKTIQGYLYYEKTGTGHASAPPAPAGNTYTFSTGLVSGTGIGTGTNTWTNVPRPQAPDAANTTHYTIRYFGTQATSTSTTATVTYSGVVQYTNFTGVVTFDSGTGLFSEGATTIQTGIDGGAITTGSIQNSTYVSTSGATGVRLNLDATGSQAVLEAKASNSAKVSINADGSATFAGTVNATSGFIGSSGTTGWRVVGANMLGGGFIDGSGNKTYSSTTGWPNANVTIDGQNSRIIVRETTSETAGVNRVILGYLA